MITKLFSVCLSWLMSDRPEYVHHWTPERARKHERETLRMLGRGETAYIWASKVRNQSRFRKSEKTRRYPRMVG